MAKSKIIAVDETNTDPLYWEKILKKQGLGNIDTADIMDDTRAKTLKQIEQALTRSNHEAFAVPRTMDELLKDIHDAIVDLQHRVSGEIVWTIHTSCSLSCDCVVVAVRGKKALHISTYHVRHYNRGRLLCYLETIGAQDVSLYE